MKKDRRRKSETFKVDEALTQKRVRASVLTAWLRRIRTFAELTMWLRVAGWYGFDLYGKRRGYWAFDWRDLGRGRVRYLYNDGVSVGQAQITNLYKIFNVR